ncbi:hypothetical protein ACF09C_24630 [Streptomyces sp. NPDC014870]|uniref:hypothetical protein n=1 Tax=Streptomyces sp. NPDC014870 TaxID=3364925 RepID=UPI0036FB0652
MTKLLSIRKPAILAALVSALAWPVPSQATAAYPDAAVVTASAEFGDYDPGDAADPEGRTPNLPAKLTLTNAGKSTARGLELKVTGDPGGAYAEPQTDDPHCRASDDDPDEVLTFVCHLDDLEPGQSVTLTVKYWELVGPYDRDTPTYWRYSYAGAGTFEGPQPVR